MSDSTHLQLFRPGSPGNEKAIVLIHGFVGKAAQTWDSFQKILSRDSDLEDWAVYGLGYPSSGFPDIMGVWAADPDIPTLSQLIATRCKVSELGQCSEIAFVAHSMGGLIIQRMLLDHEEIARKTSHFIMFGTPSNGIKKAGYARFFKRTLRNMAAGSDFVTSLRNEWREKYPTFRDSPFRLAIAAGARDQFVPIQSCHRGFPREACFVVDGDHLSIVNPSHPREDSIRLVINELKQSNNQNRIVLTKGDSYLDMMSFRKIAFPALKNPWKGIGAAKLVANALELELKGFPHEAVALLRTELSDPENLQNWTDSERTDVMGSLGGQLKRLWLADRASGENLKLGDVYQINSKDAEVPLGEFCAKEAWELYNKALNTSRKGGDSQQIYYHAINAAFMSLVHLRDRVSMKENATIAMEHATKVIEESGNKEDYWAVATQAEAYLYLDRFGKAVRRYEDASMMATKPPAFESTHIQAFVAAAELGKTEWTHLLDSLLTPWADEEDQLKTVPIPA